MKTILGLDSSTHCGWSLYLGDCGDTIVGEFHHPKERERFCRWHKYYSDLETLIDSKVSVNIDLCVIEGYAFNALFSQVPLVEIGTLLRGCLINKNIPWIEVPPTTLKKFTTGKGNAKKSSMILAVYKRWGIETSNDNIADATALMRLGMALLNPPADLPQYSKEVLKKIGSQYKP